MRFFEFAQLLSEAAYAVKYQGIDGTKTTRFSTLSGAARYLKSRDLGVDYRNPGVLQGEFGQFFLLGFEWKDVLTGSNYKPELISAPLKITFRKSKYGNGLNAFVDGESEGSVYQVDGQEKITAFLQSQHRYQLFDTIEQAKLWLKQAIEAEHKEKNPPHVPLQHDPSQSDFDNE